MTATQVIDSLNVDVAKEHAAIIQYVLHSTQMRGSGAAASVKKTAREEMWHLEWLIQAIEQRGGEPVLTRADVFTFDAILESMRADVAAEDGALEHYEVTLSTIGDTDPALTLLIERIMDDERYHKASFERLARRAETEGEAPFAASPVIGPGDVAGAGAVPVSEYQGALQYLWSRRGCGDCDDAETYFDLAVEEMRHLSMLADCFGGLGRPRVPPEVRDRIEVVGDRSSALDAVTAYEETARLAIGAAEGSVMDAELATELHRIAAQHGYHRVLLEEVRERSAG